MFVHPIYLGSKGLIYGFDMLGLELLWGEIQYQSGLYQWKTKYIRCINFQRIYYRMTATAKQNFLFVSDLEGCELYGRFNAKKQNTSMCKTAFFETLEDSYLKDKENNHICFLGDYFDQGPYVFESIIGIAYLKNKYESQVHIILGNRDINKFRLFYESKLGVFDQALIEQVNKTGMFSRLKYNMNLMI